MSEDPPRCPTMLSPIPTRRLCGPERSPGGDGGVVGEVWYSMNSTLTNSRSVHRHFVSKLL